MSPRVLKNYSKQVEQMWCYARFGTICTIEKTQNLKLYKIVPNRTKRLQ